MPAPLYLFAGGGTGGHLFPGIAVADELRRRGACRILFAGSERDVERRILAAAGIPHIPLTAEPPAKALRSPLTFLRRNWSAWRESRRLVRSDRPAVVVGLGGFASVPVAIAAHREGLPLILLEQNTLAGSANRWLAKRARAVCTSFEATSTDLPRSARIKLTGNPVRAAVAALAHESPHDVHFRRTLLILGGSQGSTRVNDAILAAMPRLREPLAGWSIVHQTGAADEERVARVYRSMGIVAESAAFFPAMERLYAKAGLVVSRAGATTLAELACAGCPAVLIPLAESARDHQQRNADAFAERGAAIVIRESREPTGSAAGIIDALAVLLTNEARRTSMSQSMWRMARPIAAEAVADVIERIIEEREPRAN